MPLKLAINIDVASGTGAPAGLEKLAPTGWHVFATLAEGTKDEVKRPDSKF